MCFNLMQSFLIFFSLNKNEIIALILLTWNWNEKQLLQKSQNYFGTKVYTFMVNKIGQDIIAVVN